MREKPTLVLLHGHGVDASIWEGIYAGLSLEGPVLRPDFSRLANHVTINGYADELSARLSADGVNDVVLIGHSMGGYIALAFAEQHPEMTRGLCLFHSTAYADDEPKKEQRTKAIGALTDGGTPKFIAELLPKMVSPDYPGEEVRSLINRFSDLPTDALIAGVRAMAGRPDRTPVLRDARFPVLLLLGEKDQVIPYEQTSQLGNLGERITVAALPQSGHLGMIEQSAEALNALRSFVARL